LINRGATPPIKLITKPSTTVAFAKLVNFYFIAVGVVIERSRALFVADFVEIKDQAVRIRIAGGDPRKTA
jgi:hypothetical protein